MIQGLKKITPITILSSQNVWKATSEILRYETIEKSGRQITVYTRDATRINNINKLPSSVCFKIPLPNIIWIGLHLGKLS